MLQNLKMAYVNDHPFVRPFTEIFHVVFSYTISRIGGCVYIVL